MIEYNVLSVGNIYFDSEHRYFTTVCKIVKTYVSHFLDKTKA